VELVLLPQTALLGKMKKEYFALFGHQVITQKLLEQMDFVL
jgi:hypothetical protein